MTRVDHEAVRLVGVMLDARHRAELAEIEAMRPTAEVLPPARSAAAHQAVRVTRSAAFRPRRRRRAEPVTVSWLPPEQVITRPPASNPTGN